MPPAPSYAKVTTAANAPIPHISGALAGDTNVRWQPISHLVELVEALTKHRQGSGPHWLMVSEIEAALRAHGVEIDGAELHQAIAIARQRCELKTEGQPVHSVSRWQQPLGGKLR